MSVKPFSSCCACTTRSRAPPSPSTAFWAERSRRSLNASTIAKISATTATAAPASATIPCVVVSSSISQAAYRPFRPCLPREHRGERSLVVCDVLLTRDGQDLHGDGDRPARRGRRGERDGGGLSLACGYRRDRLGDVDGVAGAADRQPHAHLLLVVLALVHHLNVEREVGARLELDSRALRERLPARLDGDRAEAGAVQARRDRAGAARAAADAADAVGDRRGRQPAEVEQEAALREVDLVAQAL